MKALSATFLACLALSQALVPDLRAACVPVSATLSYAADDYFYFYVNGNAVVTGTVFDAGAPPVSVSVPVGYFDPSGSNYFAAEIANSAANLVGANWLISM